MTPEFANTQQQRKNSFFQPCSLVQIMQKNVELPTVLILLVPTVLYLLVAVFAIKWDTTCSKQGLPPMPFFSRFLPALYDQ